MYNPCQFERKDYLEYSDIFENVKLEAPDLELCEFSNDIEDIAFELSYTRYHLAKAERSLGNAVEETKKACIEVLKEYAFYIDKERAMVNWMDIDNKIRAIKI